MIVRLNKTLQHARTLVPFVLGASMSIGLCSRAVAGNPFDDIAKNIGDGMGKAFDDPKSLPCDCAWKKIDNDKGFGKLIQGRVKINHRDLGASQVRSMEQLDATATRDAIKCSPSEALDAVMSSVAGELSAKLVLDPEVAKAQQKQVLLIGDINADARVKSPELNLAIKSIASNLQKNAEFNRNFVVLCMSTNDADEALKKAGANESWKFVDPLDPQSHAGPVSYNPSSIYVLTGDFLRDWDPQNVRAGMTYKILVSVNKAADRTLVQSVTTKTQYRFHPYRLAWLSQGEDDQ